MPERIQLRRTKGWRKPEGAVVVARPSKWGNPWSMVPAGVYPKAGVPERTYDVTHTDGTVLDRYFAQEGRHWVLAKFYDHLRAHPEIAADARSNLAGKDLACWCPLDQLCHADVLLEIANGSGS